MSPRLESAISEALAGIPPWARAQFESPLRELVQAILEERTSTTLEDDRGHEFGRTQ
jgi:hypothetical protein